jgi:hypothetical protein
MRRHAPFTAGMLLIAGAWPASAADNADSRDFYRPHPGDPAGKTFTYTIQTGETLFDIAARFSGDPYAAQGIAKRNGIADPLHPDAGSAIEVPAPRLAILYSVEKLVQNAAGADLEPLGASPVLTRGDRFRLRVATNCDGYLYVFNRDADGEIRRVFPAGGRKTARVRRFSNYTLPGGDEWLRMDAAKGDEDLLVLVSLQPLTDFEGELVAAGGKRQTLDSYFAEGKGADSKGITVDDPDDDGAAVVVEGPLEGTPTLVHRIRIRRAEK